MGTRHLQTIISKEGETRIRQYGQWDGYPDGQGKDILKYLKSGNLAKYQEELDKIPLLSGENQKEIEESENWSKEFPYLSRDCGSNIHQMIEDGEVRFVVHMDGDEANSWCDGFYTIDFKENTFSSDYGGKTVTYPLDNLPSEEKYLDDMKKEEECEIF